MRLLETEKYGKIIPLRKPRGGELSMVDVTSEKMLEKIPNTFILVLVATERLKEIKKGAKTLVDIDSDNPYEILSEEIIQGKLSYTHEDEE